MRELEPKDLYRSCSLDHLDFETSDDLEPFEGVLGQPRAVGAVEFGVGIDGPGYNIFAFGPPGTGKHSTLRKYLKQPAAGRPVPTDCCYVNNFDEPQKPRLLRLPAGSGRELKKDMRELIEELSTALRGTFESEEYQTRREVIEEGFKERQEEALTELSEEAKKKSLALLRTPVGMVFAPVRDGEVVSPDDFGDLPEEERKKLEQEVERLQQDLQKIFRQVPRWQREKRDKVRELNQEVSRLAIDPLISDLRKKYKELEVIGYLDAVERDVVDNAKIFLTSEDEQQPEALRILAGSSATQQQRFRRYQVNVLVDHGDTAGAPVVYEENPTYQNLVGRVEHISQMGALLTDFSLIRAGSLHHANGGYLVMDALQLLRQPFAWEGLKRALRSGQIKIESLGEALSLVSTFSLEPDAVPLDLKVVLVGEPLLYYLLSFHDPDFPRLFKVAADFGERMDSSEEGQELYARLLARLARDERLKPFQRGAVSRLIEHSSRMLGDSEKMSLFFSRILDLMREADYWAGQDNGQVVLAEHVQKALDHKVFRADRLREQIQEEIARGTLLVSTSGEVIGQVNGLAVTSLGDFSFGRPTRITARVRLGSGEVVDIEREVELGGPLHSKGVHILAGFLGERYAAERPLSLSASLVFEQSYSGVDGDSASSTELYALLSAVAQIPLKQTLAVTGSVNQRGEIQAIGGVNEKIEGFFDVCAARGLTGDQGVIIPAANVKHLMLRREVIAAVERGDFHVFPVAAVDEGIELLTGRTAGERDEDGNYPEESVNRLVEDRLSELAQRLKEFSKPAPGEGAGAAAAMSGAEGGDR